MIPHPGWTGSGPRSIYRHDSFASVVRSSTRILNFRRSVATSRREEMELSTGPQGGSEKVSSIQIDANTPSELQGDCEKAAGRDIGVLNANVVDWNNAEDIENPQNFKSREKWTIIVLVSAITFNQ